MIATKDRLAAELRKIADEYTPSNVGKYRALADRAETGEFDDFSDVHICGPTALHRELMNFGAAKFAKRVASGEFDASMDESEEWARKQTDPEVIGLMDKLGLGPKRGNDQ